jgi:hypothetical protein
VNTRQDGYAAGIFKRVTLVSGKNCLAVCDGDKVAREQRAKLCNRFTFSCLLSATGPDSCARKRRKKRRARKGNRFTVPASCGNVRFQAISDMV